MKDDHCTALPAKWVSQEMNLCCKQHDIDYVEQVKTKLDADLDFYHCVKNETGELLAGVLFVIVLVFGAFFWYKRKIKR